MGDPLFDPRLIAGVRNHSPYAAWAQAGFTPSEITARILSTVTPLYEHPSVLDDIPFEVLAKEAVTVGAIQSDCRSAKLFDLVLAHYRASVVANPVGSVSALLYWDAAIVRAGAEFISIYLTELDKAELPLEETRLELLRNIGGLLEACAQPHLKSLLHHVLIARDEPSDGKQIDRMRLGQVVDRLWQTTDCQELLAPAPWRLKLNTWRNVAQHHSAVVVDDHIVCDYREGKADRTITLRRDEMIEAARDLQLMLAVLRSARFVFVTDNTELLRTHAPAGLKVAPPRRELEFIEFASLIATQGFSIVGIESTEECTHLSVRDETDEPSRERALHASQFVVGTWQYFPRSIIRVTYIDKMGRSFMSVTSSGSDCKDIAEGRVPFEELANRVTFTLHSGDSNADEGTPAEHKP